MFFQKARVTARLSAVAATAVQPMLRGLVEASGGIPEKIWTDPYAIGWISGFAATSASIYAKQNHLPDDAVAQSMKSGEIMASRARQPARRPSLNNLVRERATTPMREVRQGKGNVLARPSTRSSYRASRCADPAARQRAWRGGLSLSPRYRPTIGDGIAPYSAVLHRERGR